MVTTTITTIVFLAARQRPTQNPTAFLYWLVLTVLLLPVLLIGISTATNPGSYDILSGAAVCKSSCIRGLTVARRDLASSVIWKQYGKAIEYIVVIPIATLLFFMPPLEQSRQTARRTQCRNNLKQIGLAFREFHESHGRFPAASGPLPNSDITGPPVSWRVALLPLLEKKLCSTGITPTNHGTLPQTSHCNIRRSGNFSAQLSRN